MRILQLLNWKLKSIEFILPLIKKQGFDAIQLNPMQPYKEEKDFYWWSSYQPLGFRIGNIFGTKEDLISLCKKASEYGIKIYVDVISNHMANLSGEEPYTPHYTVDKCLTENKTFWKPKVGLTTDNRHDCVRHCIGLPGFELSNPELQKYVLNYLNELKECGVSGYRFDAAKHIGLPNDGVDFFKHVKEFTSKNNLYTYGEILGGTKEWRDEMSEYLDVLTEQYNEISNEDKRVTFVESHDTYLNSPNGSMKKSTSQINHEYQELTKNMKNTIYYARALKYPYQPFKNKTSDTNIKDLNELEFFDLSFLTSPEVKEANQENLIEEQVITSTIKEIIISDLIKGLINPSIVPSQVTLLPYLLTSIKSKPKTKQLIRKKF